MANRSNINFNSIKVQLERSTSKVRGIQIKFQFHKGTIRTQNLTKERGVQRDFNSIKVQLEPIGPLFKMSSVPTFQFHKGTIRTCIPLE